MLNKNQSKRWNSWKYAIIVPALVIFMWQFQVKVIAQEKRGEAILENQALSRIEQEVKATTSELELKEASSLFKQEFGAILEFSRIKRNKKGEITAIKATIKRKSGDKDSKSVYQVSGDEPIKSFKVFIDVDENGKELVGFGDATKQRTVYHATTTTGAAVAIEADEIVEKSYYNSDSESPEPPAAPTPPTPPSAPNYPAPPAAPNFPTPPTPPTAPKTDSNKQAWTDFEKEMEKFKSEMSGDAMKKYKEEMKEYAREMAAMTVESAGFKEEMKRFQKEMTEYQKELLESHSEAQNGRELAQRERQEAHKAREKEREKAVIEREKAKKEREAAQKQRN